MGELQNPVSDLTDLPNLCIRQSVPAGPIARQAFSPVVPMFILMIKKYVNVLLGLTLAAAVGGPIAYFHFFGHGNSPFQATAAEPPAGVTQGASYQGAASHVEGAPDAKITANIAGPGSPDTTAARRTSVRVQDASSVFDFQITPEWIVAHWPAVSTGLAQLQLEGYRVPLVTGTAQHDLAGSLTYYFNAEQKLQQITFVGTTGDPTTVDRAADHALPSDPAAGERSGPGRLRGGPLQQSAGQQSTDPSGAVGPAQRRLPPLRRRAFPGPAGGVGPFCRNGLMCDDLATGPKVSSSGLEHNSPSRQERPTTHRPAAGRRRGRARPWGAANRARSAARSRRSGKCGRCRCSG